MGEIVFFLELGGDPTATLVANSFRNGHAIF
jgi:hypothetical protein